MELRRAFVDTPWGPIHYRQGGAGAPLLLLHSSSGSSRVYRRLMAALPGRRCIAPDLPGFGDSVPLPQGATIPDIAAQVASFLDALGIERADVFGLHSGNKLAAALAADFPQRVRRLVLAGMTHSLVVDAGKRNAAVLGYAGRTAATQGWEALADKLRKLLVEPLPLTSAGTPDTDRQMTELLDALQAHDGANALYPANVAFDLAAALKRIPAPTLIMELVTPGESDLGRQGPLITALMSDGRTLAMEGNDREWLQIRSRELAAYLQTFLD